MSEIKFSSGSLYIEELDKSILLADSLSGIAEFEFSPNEVAPIHFDLHSHKEASFSCEIDYVDLELLNKNSVSPMSTVPFTLTHERNIMIQARWHKKTRVRKKWLRRYGMKPDTIQVVYDIGELSYDHSDGSFDFETTYYRNVLRPDQKRRGLKIEY